MRHYSVVSFGVQKTRLVFQLSYLMSSLLICEMGIRRVTCVTGLLKEFSKIHSFKIKYWSQLGVGPLMEASRVNYMNTDFNFLLYIRMQLQQSQDSGIGGHGVHISSQVHQEHIGTILTEHSQHYMTLVEGLGHLRGQEKSLSNWAGGWV